MDHQNKVLPMVTISNKLFSSQIGYKIDHETENYLFFPLSHKWLVKGLQPSENVDRLPQEVKLNIKWSILLSIHFLWGLEFLQPLPNLGI